MLKKEVVFIIFSLMLLIGAGCQQNTEFEACSGLSKGDLQLCIDTNLLNQAVETKDSSLCEKINDLTLVEACYLNSNA